MIFSIHQEATKWSSTTTSCQRTTSYVKFAVLCTRSHADNLAQGLAEAGQDLGESIFESILRRGDGAGEELRTDVEDLRIEPWRRNDGQILDKQEHCSYPSSTSPARRSLGEWLDPRRPLLPVPLLCSDSDLLFDAPRNDTTSGSGVREQMDWKRRRSLTIRGTRIHHRGAQARWHPKEGGFVYRYRCRPPTTIQVRGGPEAQRRPTEGVQDPIGRLPQEGWQAQVW